jgi:hypothetical protein
VSEAARQAGQIAEATAITPSANFAIARKHNPVDWRYDGCVAQIFLRLFQCSFGLFNLSFCPGYSGLCHSKIDDGLLLPVYRKLYRFQLGILLRFGLDGMKNEVEL